MATINVSLNPDEVALLLRLVETAVSETKVELHRTHFSPTFRDGVKDEAKLLQDLRERFRQAASTA